VIVVASYDEVSMAGISEFGWYTVHLIYMCISGYVFSLITFYSNKIFSDFKKMITQAFTVLFFWGGGGIYMGGL